MRGVELQSVELQSVKHRGLIVDEVVLSQPVKPYQMSNRISNRMSKGAKHGRS